MQYYRSSHHNFIYKYILLSRRSTTNIRSSLVKTKLGESAKVLGFEISSLSHGEEESEEETICSPADSLKHFRGIFLDHGIDCANNFLPHTCFKTTGTLEQNVFDFKVFKKSFRRYKIICHARC